VASVVAEGKTSEKEDQQCYYYRDFCKKRGIGSIFKHGTELIEERTFRLIACPKCYEQTKDPDISCEFSFFKNSTASKKFSAICCDGDKVIGAYLVFT